MPAVEVVVKRSLLQQLPLLKDLQRFTPKGKAITAPADFPCSVWGLVSLLIHMPRFKELPKPKAAVH